MEYRIAALGFAITVVPTACLVAGTFMNLFGHFELAQVWTTSQWTKVLADPVLLHSLYNTLVIAGSATPGGNDPAFTVYQRQE